MTIQTSVFTYVQPEIVTLDRTEAALTQSALTSVPKDRSGLLLWQEPIDNASRSSCHVFVHEEDT